MSKPRPLQRSDPLAELRVLERERRTRARIRRQQAAYRALAKRVRIRKSFRGRIVPLAVAGKLKGKIVSTRYRGKVLLLQITRTGKKRFFHEVRGQQDFKAKHLSSFNIARAPRSRQTIEKFYVNLIPTRTAKARMIPTPGERLARSGVSFDRVVKEIAKDLIARSRARSGKQFIIYLTVKVKGLKLFTAIADFKVGAFQKLTVGNVRSFVLGVLWSQIAQWLARHDMVSMGSSAYIARLKTNQGKDPSKWKREDGEKWGKHNYDEVRFEVVSWDIKRIAIGKERSE